MTEGEITRGEREEDAPFPDSVSFGFHEQRNRVMRKRGDGGTVGYSLRRPTELRQSLSRYTGRKTKGTGAHRRA